MEIAGSVSSILQHKGAQIWSIGPKATVFEAIALMAEKNVGALPILAGEKLVGILTERDYTRKVILKGKSSKQTPIEDIMTGSLVVAGPNDSVTGCMKIMLERRLRHLPVMENEKLMGIISMGDLVRWVISAQAATIDQLESYVTGGYSA